MKRRRHFPTVVRFTPRRSATSMSLPPCAHANTIRHRNANACAVLGRRAQRDSVWYSSSVRTRADFGRPAVTMLDSHRR